MSLTNAVSGIIIIGAIIAAAPISFGPGGALGYIAVFFAAINIFGGFVVTERMLEMFKKK
jgi:NAD(P) transhydrogenase subunit alpha